MVIKDRLLIWCSSSVKCQKWNIFTNNIFISIDKIRTLAVIQNILNKILSANSPKCISIELAIFMVAFAIIPFTDGGIEIVIDSFSLGSMLSSPSYPIVWFVALDPSEPLF